MTSIRCPVPNRKLRAIPRFEGRVFTLKNSKACSSTLGPRTTEGSPIQNPDEGTRLRQERDEAVNLLREWVGAAFEEPFPRASTQAFLARLDATPVAHRGLQAENCALRTLLAQAESYLRTLRREQRRFN